MFGLGLSFSHAAVQRQGVSAVPSAIAYSILVDELGNRQTDEFGNTRVGQDGSGPALIRDAAARRGLKFGIAYKPDDPNDSTAYRNLVLSEAGMLIPETAALATTWCTGRATYDFSRLAVFNTIATGAGLQWKVPSGFIYPAHDMAWVSDDTGGAIVPVNDGTGTPAVRADTWQAIIDELVARFRLYCDTTGTYPVAINASNELTDPDQVDGWRRHPWYTATGGPGWVVYLIQRLKATFPGVAIGLCQDLLEQPHGGSFGDGYGTRMQAAFLANLDTLIAAGAKPDYVDAQGHFRDDRGWNPVAFNTLLTAIRAKGIKIVAGEIDFRVRTLANYTNAGNDALTAYQISQYLDVLIPHLDGGLLVAWTIGDAFGAGSWGVGQRTTLYDTALVVKSAYYAAYREQLNWR